MAIDIVESKLAELDSKDFGNKFMRSNEVKGINYKRGARKFGRIMRGRKTEQETIDIFIGDDTCF